jgi:hypothetical protein
MWDRGSNAESFLGIGDGRHSEPARKAFNLTGVLHYLWLDRLLG